VSSLRARRAGVGPCGPCVEEGLARDGDRGAAKAGRPAPGDERIVEVLAQRGRVHAAVVGGVLDLLAQGARRDADEDEPLLGLGHAPAGRCARWGVGAVGVGRIGRAVAGGAALADHALAVGAALHVLVVRAAVVALQRGVAARVAVLAARVLEDAAHGLECCEAVLAHRASARRLGRRGLTAGGGDEKAKGSTKREANGAAEHAEHCGSGHGVLDVVDVVGCDGQDTRSGSERSRCLVSANTALATAGAIGAVAGSPMPPIRALLAMMWTETLGI